MVYKELTAPNIFADIRQHLRVTSQKRKVFFS